MRIQNNIMAMNAHRALAKNTSEQAKSLEKLSSGYSINRAADDAAGLSISEKMRSQISGLNRAVENAEDGISFIQTAEGAMDEVSSMLTRLKELAVQKADGTFDDSTDIENLGLEMTQLGEEISKILNDTKYNGKAVITSGSINIAVSDDDTDTFDISLGSTIYNSLSSTCGIGTAALSSASTTSDIDAAINAVNSARSTFGAKQNRLESKVDNLSNTVENLQSSESRIRDTDMAEEMANFNKYNILVQAATSMLAQANSAVSYTHLTLP
ncbi:MAG: flagellin, partial [Clostridia bacterium]|nr:flagellin [Clostridia bacterium]